MDVEGYPAALALGAMMCLGVSDLLNKRAMRAGVRRAQFLVVQSVFFTVTTLALMPLVGGLEWRPELLYAVACGAITFVSYVFVLRALEVGEASVAVPIYRMSFGVTVVLAVVFLGEEITVRKMLGFLLIFAALVTLTSVKGGVRGEGPFQSTEGLPVGRGGALGRSLAVSGALAAVAMVTIGTKGFLYKVGVAEGAPPATFALVQSLTFLPIAAAYLRLRDGSTSVEGLTWRHAPWNGVLTALASVLLLLSLVEGDATVSVPISQLCFVVTAVLAVALLGERMTAWKVAGVAAAVLAVVVLSTTLVPL